MQECRRSSCACAVEQKTVAVLGTGDFGRALGSRLLSSGFHVVFGSRDPGKINLGKIDPTLNGVEVLSITDCLNSSNVIILALHSHDQDQLRHHGKILTGKIVVDVSNPTKILPHCSNAECLARQIPSARMVKAFNTVSAHALREEWAGSSRVVPVCGDDPEARGIVQQLASSIGLHAVDGGGLAMARKLETSQQSLCDGWGAALIVTAFIFVFWFVYSICRYYVLRSSPYTWERLPLNTVNKVMGCISITQLAFCYLPGSIAALVQICNGNKHQRFPAFLDGWLKMRKPLGLMALMFALLHMFMSMALLTPAYYSKFFLKSSATVPGNSTQDVTVSFGSRFSWMGETTLMLAFFAVAVMSIVGISSLPTVGNRLNWRQWDFIQSFLGYGSLVLTCAHVTVKGAPGWVTSDFVTILQGLSFLSQVIPYITLFLKLVLLMPCISAYIGKIRRGWVRGLSDNNVSARKQQYAYDNMPLSVTSESETVVTGHVAAMTSNGNVPPPEYDCVLCCAEAGCCGKGKLGVEAQGDNEGNKGELGGSGEVNNQRQDMVHTIDIEDIGRHKLPRTDGEMGMQPTTQL